MKFKTFTLSSLFCIPVLVTACSGNDTPSSTPDMTTQDEVDADMDRLVDMTMTDMAPDELDMAQDMSEVIKPDAEVDLDMCEPLAECPMNACGQLSDGCGGLIDCGACACTAGVPESETCGACGLGLSRCDGGADTLALAGCDYPGGHEALGEITDCSRIVYVDAAAEAGGDGSPDAPFVTYQEALDVFLPGDRGAIIVDEGTYQEQLVLKDGVHVFSAYARLRDSWIQKPSSLASFVAPRIMNEPAIGLRAEDITTPTIVHSVQVEPPEALPEETTYGAYLNRVEGLTISDSLILGKEGGAGAPGMVGSPGADGTDGQVGVCMLVGVGVRSSDGGAAGINTSCPEANGGQGGAGARYLGAQGNVQGTQGEHGADGNSTGGAPGDLNTGSTGPASGEDGSRPSGHTQPVAPHGEGGKAGGMLVDGLWVTTGHGTDGEKGDGGSGGAGGGGAGGNRMRAQEQGGGGGGAGGCGGEPGTAGRAGGASFGVLALETQATFVNTTVYARDGGQGGDGASGGAGGAGGDGAFVGSRDCTDTVRVWSAGSGADGVDGQAGGSGGGGASGDSYGAFCEGSTLIVEGSTFEAGRPADAGQGDVPGEVGRVEDEVNCR